MIAVVAGGDSDSVLVPLFVDDPIHYNIGTIIGIDLGNSHSRVGVVRINGHVEIIPNSKTPNWISFTKNQTLIGEAAKNQATLNPQGTIFDVKRLLGREFDDPVVQKEIEVSSYKIVNKEGKPYIQVKVRGETKLFSPEELTAIFLGKMKAMAENRLGQRIRKVVITTPGEPYGNPPWIWRGAIENAAALAGFQEVTVFEHRAVALFAYNLHTKNAYHLHKKKGENYILLFRLSGGRCDVSILFNKGGVLVDVLSVIEDSHSVGEGFDQRVVNYFIGIIKSKYDRDISKDKRALKKLVKECERAKIALSSHDQVVVEIESLFDGVNFSEPLTRTKFEELNEDLFEEIMVLVEKALEEAGLKKKDIHDILLVGGSTRIPKVRKLLRDLFDGKEPNKATHVNPDEVLTYGALVLGGFYYSNQLNFFGRGLLMSEIAPASFGIETVGGVMTKIIPRYNAVPCIKKKTFTTIQDYLTNISIKIYGGEGRMTKYCHKVGEFNLSGILPAPRGVPQIEITFQFDHNGLLHVKAEDKASNTSAIDDGRYLTREEIDKMDKIADDLVEEQEKIDFLMNKQFSPWMYNLL
ncbi:Heat shock protein 70 family [Trema orientale]|uniref:Heat shock protein 70 family n=1 Tax=Trema orientale TaxID=63057 RepID=A0A2P5EN54_TREOI|nr:Heat shock protein 70 family [Trema orientale]